MYKLSVIVPVFNGEKYIQKCLLSIIKQSYKNIEIIVVDDGSYDNTAVQVKSIMRSDDRIKYFYQKNRGVSAARNKGLDEAMGDYVAFVDADDAIEAEMYEIMLADIIFYSADIVFCDLAYVDINTGNIVKTGQLLDRDNGLISDNNIGLQELLKSGGYCGNKLIKKDLIENVRFHEDIHMCEDLLFWFEALYSKKPLKIVYNNRQLYYYAIRLDSACKIGITDYDMTFMEAYRRMVSLCTDEKVLHTIIYLYVNNIIGHVHKYYKEKWGHRNLDYLNLLRRELVNCNNNYVLVFKQRCYITLFLVCPRMANMIYITQKAEESTMNPRVEVLMSTYNGEKYLSSQIESILNQEKVDVFLLIRDDGSTDTTSQILRDYEMTFDNIQVIYGKNIGWKKSFFELLELSNDNMDFYAFSDQDDVWMSDKLMNSIKQDMCADVPVLHQSISQIVDSELNPVPDYRVYSNPKNVNEALTCSWAQGAAMTFNKKARDLAISYRPNDNAAHDVWIYLICYFMGQIIFETRPALQYRQHENNVTGGAASGRSVWGLSFIKNQIRKLFEGKLYCNYGFEIYSGFETYLNPEQKKALKVWYEYKRVFSAKCKLLVDKTVCRRTIGGSIALKTAILFSLY